jgi:putative Mn2+ efflux pump MntP
MESLFLIVALAVGLAMDAFAVAVAQGAAGHNSMFHATRTGMAFGVAQGIMPFLGWALGIAFVSHISAYDHWIALILLSGLGMKMLWDARAGNENDSAPGLSGLALATAAIATSIDAFAVGITLPALDLPVLLTCISIGIITALLSSLGVMIGGMASSRIGKYAEVAGGVILISLGIKIFVEH